MGKTRGRSLSSKASANLGRWGLGDARMRVVLVSLAGEIVIAAIKFIAGAISGSSAMISEGVHTLIDGATELILLFGLVSSRRRGNPEHQLGFGREVFFWNFVVAVLIFALGSGITLVAGLSQIMHPTPLDNEWVNFVVLGCSAIVEAIGLRLAFKAPLESGKHESLYRLLSRSRDPTSLTVFFGGIASIVGLLVTAIGLIASIVADNSVFDGIASIAIAAILAITAAKLAIESKSLLIGVPADIRVVRTIVGAVKENRAVQQVNGMISVHLSPDQLLVALSVAFNEDLGTSDIERAIAEIETELHASHPQIVALFLKPQSAARYAEVHGKSAPVAFFADVKTIVATPYATM